MTENHPPVAGDETLRELMDYLRDEAEHADENCRGSLGRAEELGVTPDGESYRRSAYRSQEAADDFRRWLAYLAALRPAPEPDEEPMGLRQAQDAMRHACDSIEKGLVEKGILPAPEAAAQRCPTCGCDGQSADSHYHAAPPAPASAPVAWQKCPVCDGQGLVIRPPHIAGDQPTWTSSSTAPYPCRRCAGTGTIAAPASGEQRAEVTESDLRYLEELRESYPVAYGPTIIRILAAIRARQGEMK